MSQSNLLATFRKTYLDFIDELIDQFPNESDLIIARVFFSDQVPVSLVIEKFIEKVLPHENQIKSRNEDYFLSEENVFSTTHNKEVIKFRKLWPQLDKENREAVFQWFDAMIAITKIYKKNKGK